MKQKIVLAFSIVIFVVLFRLARHSGVFALPPNMAPVSAAALFTAVHVDKRLAVLVPLVAMAISDVFIGFYSFAVLVSVYGSFAAIGIVGIILKRHYDTATTVAASLTASTLFFVFTNAAVWWFTPLYENTLTGLMSAYYMAIPFYKFTLVGDLVFVGVFFGTYELIGAALTAYYQRSGRRIVSPQQQHTDHSL